MEAVVGREPAAPGSTLNSAAVALGVDDEHAGRRDDDVVDVRARPRNPPVVQDGHSFLAQPVEGRAERDLPAGSVRPGRGRARIAPEGEDGPAQLAVALADPRFAQLVATFPLPRRGAAGDTAVDRRFLVFRSCTAQARCRLPRPIPVRLCPRLKSQPTAGTGRGVAQADRGGRHATSIGADRAGSRSLGCGQLHEPAERVRESHLLDRPAVDLEEPW